MVAGGSTVPVGLFGLHRNTTVGRTDATSSAASVGDTKKSSRRAPSTTAVPVTRAMWACRAYVGSNISARRPGPS